MQKQSEFQIEFILTRYYLKDCKSTYDNNNNNNVKKMKINNFLFVNSLCRLWLVCFEQKLLYSFLYLFMLNYTNFIRQNPNLIIEREWIQKEQHGHLKSFGSWLIIMNKKEGKQKNFEEPQ